MTQQTSNKFKALEYRIADGEKVPPGPKLNLGCGSFLRLPSDGWVNLDKYARHPDVVRWDLETGVLPWPDNHFAYVLAIDVLEHIPHRSPNQEVVGELFLQVVSELIRTSRDGARWLVMTPSKAQSMEAFGHCRVVTPTTFSAFNQRRSSGESPLCSRFGHVRVVRVQQIRSWGLNAWFGRSHENVIWLRVVK